MKNTQGRSFVMIMVFIALSSLVLRILIGIVIKINTDQNESYASLTLKFISAALENYAQDNHGIYPLSLSVLTQTRPAYLDKKYIENIERPAFKGYNYNCLKLDSSGYNCSAVPVKCNLTGKLIYTIANGVSLKWDTCEKRE